VTLTGYEPRLCTLIALFAHCLSLLSLLPFLDPSAASPSLRPIQTEVFASIKFSSSLCCFCPSLRPIQLYTPPLHTPFACCCPEPWYIHPHHQSPSIQPITHPSLSTCLTPTWTNFLSLSSMVVLPNKLNSPMSSMSLPLGATSSQSSSSPCTGTS